MLKIDSKMEWTEELIGAVYQEIETIAKEELNLDPQKDLYTNQIEIVSAEQMLDAYTSIGLPVHYHHWSFGKDFVKNQNGYAKGEQGLALEIIINSSPCIALLMEENSMLEQTMVLAHACVSGDTEYLSPTGWKRIDQYDGGLVAQYSFETNSVEFVQPQRHIVRDQVEFIHMISDSLEQKMTPDHVVPFINGNGNLVKITAEELQNRHNTKTRGFNGKFITGFNNQSGIGIPLSDAEIKLHIAIKADGSYIKRVESDNFNCVDYHRVRFHLKKERKIDRLKEILVELGIEFSEVIGSDSATNITFNLSSKVDKRYTSDWYGASQSQLQVIANEVVLWDGHAAGNVFVSEHKVDADFVQFAFASTNRHATLNQQQKQDGTSKVWVVNWSSTPYKTLSRHGGEGRKEKQQMGNIPSIDGKAYCFTVDSGMFVSRLNNRIMVQGNCIGHNAVFANNVYFKTWTDATSIIDYMVFAREYIRTCEERYGYDEVEKVIDACHAIQTHGVDKYKRKNKSAFSDDGILQELITADEQRQKELDIILQKTTHHVADQQNETRDEEEENLLYFIMKKSPNLARWKREMVRIIYKINQYFYPQTMCQTVHEGMATFCHHYIMTRLEEKGILTPDAYLAFLKSHSGVVYQPEYDKKWYSGPNPYALGFNIFRDLKRMCEEPTDEDREWFPNIVGKDWREVVKDAAFNYRDDSFINQFLSPKVIRDMKLFSVAIDYPERVKDKTKAIVSEIHDDIGYRSIRTQLAESKQRVNRTPQISIIGCDLDGDRVLKLKYTTYQNREIDIADAKMVMMHMDYLWGYPVSLKTKD